MDRRDFLKKTGLALAGSAIGSACGRRTVEPPEDTARDDRAPGAPAEDAARDGKWVILVTIDTLRADHVSCYGYPRPTTPFLDEMAANGVRFANCFSHCGSTHPSHTTMFTGLEQVQHGVECNRSPQVAPCILTLPQVFEERGYETAAFTSAAVVTPLGRLFREFNAREYRPGTYQPAGQTVNQARSWLAGRSTGENVFLWVHVFDPHQWHLDRQPQSRHKAMQIPSDGERDELLAYWRDVQLKATQAVRPRPAKKLDGDVEKFVRKQNNYDARIRYVDDELRKLHTVVQERGPREVFWMITSDHGEGLGNHEYANHAMFIYHEILRVPLIMRFPDDAHAGTVLDEAASHTDLFPTLAGIVGESPERQLFPVQGRSLMSLIEGGDARGGEQAIFAHRQLRHPRFMLSQLWEPDRIFALHDRNWKYIHHERGQSEFYDLSADPFEMENLEPSAPAAMATLKAEALERFEAFKRDAAKRVELDPREEEVDPGREEALDALGYA